MDFQAVFSIPDLCICASRIFLPKNTAYSPLIFQSDLHKYREKKICCTMTDLNFTALKTEFFQKIQFLYQIAIAFIRYDCLFLFICRKIFFSKACLHR